MRSDPKFFTSELNYINSARLTHESDDAKNTVGNR